MDGAFVDRPGNYPLRQPKKVVTIPVRFVESERTRSDSALKIQKAFRGFFARKNMKKINAVKRELDGIDKMVLDKENVELICKNEKERLKVNETLMSLLFMLDSVRGVDFGVRDYRKGVIKRVIALQEKIDAIAVDNVESDAKVVEETIGINVSEESTDAADQDLQLEGKIPDYEESASDTFDNYNDLKFREDQTVEAQLEVGEVEDTLEFANNGGLVEYVDNEMNNTAESPARLMVTSEDENPPSLMENCEEKKNLKHDEESDGKRKLLEKITKDNERMIGLMEELFQRNEMQGLLLSSLCRRVEQLEKGLMCERLRRKKKRQSASDSGKRCNK